MRGKLASTPPHQSVSQTASPQGEAFLGHGSTIFLHSPNLQRIDPHHLLFPWYNNPITGGNPAPKDTPIRREPSMTHLITTYLHQKVIITRVETLRLMAEIDAAIPSWPVE